MREVTSKRTGNTFWLITRDEVEAAPGSHPTHGGRRLRSACPIHDGDNREAFEVNLETGWGRCYTHGCQAKVVESDEQNPWHVHQHPPMRSPRPTPPPPSDEDIAEHEERLCDLSVSLERAAEHLAGSPGADYLASRRIPATIAQAYGVGWVGNRIRNPDMQQLVRRVIFPLTRPDGRATSLTGRAIDREREPRYWNLPAHQYPKGWFNGGAITAAREQGTTLWICEGPMDALAMIAGGARHSVAVAGTSDFRERWLRGLARAVVCFDTDETGQKRRVEWVSKLSALGVDAVSLPASALEGCNDLAQFWKEHGRLPAIITDAIAQDTAQGNISQPPANVRPLRPWTIGAASDACESLPPQPKLAAYALSYELLIWDDDELEALAGGLDDDLRLCAADEPLPDDVATWLFALKNCRYMKRMRRADAVAA